ncbi:hypothetical protein D187_010521 [Cystobacter fuscus DSM 2262]|uniref:Uncharacterized protein n=1 Tax=Cystobacter fuscus (strain ATCC 25194 / DSM 2262 / NBRC 100088 / M29) TaxID=1242864 RepID=S9PHL4_CYSF2|nr:hypothetical protein D187_010521 [Cystobacter fuscus DSM 2262]
MRQFSVVAPGPIQDSGRPRGLSERQQKQRGRRGRVVARGRDKNGTKPEKMSEPLNTDCRDHVWHGEADTRVPSRGPRKFISQGEADYVATGTAWFCEDFLVRGGGGLVVGDGTCRARRGRGVSRQLGRGNGLQRR